jgi:hypothetical protein
MIIFSLLFLSLSTLIGCVGALLIGQLLPAVSALSLVLGCAAALYLARSWKLQFRMPPVSLPVFALYALIMAGIYFHSIFLFYKKGDNFWIQNNFNLGDMSFHWSAIRSIAKGMHFWPDNPIYGGYRFRYPFGMDFFNSFFENLGVDIATHLPFVTLLLLLLVFFTLHSVGGPLLVFAVFFSCGYFSFFGGWSPGDYAQLQQPLDFKNIFLTILLTQRGFLYAMPVGTLLYRVVQKYFAGEWKPSLTEKIIIGILWGGLGFFHLHTFFFVSMFLGLWILWKRDFKNWLIPLGLAALLGLPFVANALVPEAGTNSLIHWNWRGWNRPQEVGYFSYWALNLGVWIVAVLTAMVVFARKKKWNLFVPTAASFVFFILFSHLILAPWDWDNIKLLVWCYLFALMGLTDFLWYARDRWFKAGVCFCLIPGFIVFVRSLPVYSHGIQWASERELNKTDVLMKGRDVNEGVMITPTYDHPVMLLGHKLFMGYPGHVWSHGYNYTQREALVNRVYDGEGEAVASLPKDQVHWIYSGPLEKRREKLSFPSNNLLKVAEALDHELYTFEQK